MGSQTQLASDVDRRRGGTAIAMLRRETRAAHLRLERDLGVMSPGLTLGEYRRLLVGFAALHQTLDREVGRQLATAAPHEALVELDIDARRRTPSLARDLHRLGIPLPSPVGFPLHSPAGALGALYVSEGATLGGSVIAPHVRSVLGEDTPVAFFESTGVDVHRRWATCRRAIDRLLVSPAERAEAADVAVALFDRFADVLHR